MARALFTGALDPAFEIRIVNTLMRSFPQPRGPERLAAGIGRAVRTVREILSWRPDIVFAFCVHGTSYYEKSALLILSKRVGARTYLSPRSGLQTRWLEKSHAGRAWLRWSQRFIDGFLIQSEFWIEVHARFGIPRHKMHLWYNHVDTDRWEPVARGRRVPEGGRPFRFLFLGWAIADKGLPELVEAAERLDLLPGPTFEVVVAGDGAVARQLRERRALGRLTPRIVLAGWVTGEAQERELAAADALVLPTHYEGLPNVVLEAMACGLPVISTPVGAIPEVVGDGETGILVPVRDPRGLVAAMDRLRRDPTLSIAMGRRGRERVRSRFDRRIAVARFIDLLGGRRDLQ